MRVFGYRSRRTPTARQSPFPSKDGAHGKAPKYTQGKSLCGLKMGRDLEGARKPFLR